MKYFTIINNVILSINSIKFDNSLFANSELVITDQALNVIYIKRFNTDTNIVPIEVGDNVSNYGNNALLLSLIRKSVATVKLDEHSLDFMNSLVSICSPIQRESGEVIAYCGLFIKESHFENSMVLFIEVLTKLIYEKLVNYSIFDIYEIRNMEFNFINELSKRELEIVKLISQSLTDKEIANKLLISKSTVCTHLRVLFSKYGIKSRTELISKYHHSLTLNVHKNIKFS